MSGGRDDMATAHTTRPVRVTAAVQVVQAVPVAAAVPTPDLGRLLDAASRAHDRVVRDAMLSDGSCTKRAFDVLGESLAGPPRSQLDLGRTLGLDRTVMVGVVDELEDLGLVERRLDPADRRVRLVVPTSAGRRQHALLRARLATVVDELTAGLTDDDRNALTTALALIAENGLGESACDEPGCDPAE